MALLAVTPSRALLRLACGADVVQEATGHAASGIAGEERPGVDPQAWRERGSGVLAHRKPPAPGPSMTIGELRATTAGARSPGKPARQPSSRLSAPRRKHEGALGLAQVGDPASKRGNVLATGDLGVRGQPSATAGSVSRDLV